jgi:hypothetical protein
MIAGAGLEPEAMLSGREGASVLGEVQPEERALLGRRLWHGEPIAGRLVLHLEHGHGDGFMMLRWVRAVRQRVGALCLRVRPELLPVLQGQWSDVELVSWSDDLPECEYVVASYNLPHLFGASTPEDMTFPPYLQARETFRPLAGDFRVGLRWAGLPWNDSDHRRSTQLRSWEAVLQVPGVTFHSLQLNDGAEPIRHIDPRIHDLAPELTDWAQTAAAMMELDLIISVDTSCAHLAGALGRPVWVRCRNGGGCSSGQTRPGIHPPDTSASCGSASGIRCSPRSRRPCACWWSGAGWKPPRGTFPVAKRPLHVAFST